jgi:hypothetical protein
MHSPASAPPISCRGRRGRPRTTNWLVMLGASCAIAYLTISQSNTAYSVMSAVSKLGALSLTYPYQVVRSRIQVSVALSSWYRSFFFVHIGNTELRAIGLSHPCSLNWLAVASLYHIFDPRFITFALSFISPWLELSVRAYRRSPLSVRFRHCDLGSRPTYLHPLSFTSFYSLSCYGSLTILTVSSSEQCSSLPLPDHLRLRESDILGGRRTRILSRPGDKLGAGATRHLCYFCRVREHRMDAEESCSEERRGASTCLKM